MSAGARGQSLTVDYLVAGSLDGTTTAPEVQLGQGGTPFDASAQIYQPAPVEDLGLIDPDLGAGGSIGPRCIGQLLVDLRGEVAPPGSRVIVAAQRGTELVELEEVLDLSGETTAFKGTAFVVPQGAVLLLVGPTAGAEPILVRVSIETPSDPCLLLVALAAAKGSGLIVLGDGTYLGIARAMNFTGDGVTAALVGDVAVVDVPGPAPNIKELFFGAEYNAGHGDFRVRQISSTGNFDFTFLVPKDFGTLVELVMVAIPDGTAAAADIDLSSDYGAAGEAFNTHSEANTTITYPLVTNELVEMDISSVYAAISAGDYCGLNMNHQALGFTVDYLGIEIRYIPA